jgi:hypothetical protein
MRVNYLVLFLLIITAAGCKKYGPAGKRSLIDFVSEPAGVNCPNGGYKVLSGIDLNSDNILEANEVEATQYICNGSNGSNSLISILPEPAGINCTSGGYKILTGVDVNNNGTLDSKEVENTKFICNGNNGLNGSNGANSLINVVPVAAGGDCANGGYKIQTGLDADGSGTLDASEVQNTQFVCNGANGNNSLFSIKTEAPGINCTNGGFKVGYGKDANGNGILDEDEIENSVFICNGSGEGDKETRISIDFSANTTSSTSVKGIGFYGFDKDNYAGVDSIVFVGAPYSGNPNNNSILALYDFTANQVVPGTEMKSNKDYNSSSNIFTQNLLNIIPAGKRDLGVILRSEVDGQYSAMKGNCYLYLYRK